MEYRHTQVAYALITIFSSVLFLLSWQIFADRDGSGASFAFFVIAVGLLLFPTLTVEIRNGDLIWKFGLGLIRKKVPLSEVARAAQIRTGLLHGWGIHRIRGGWLYNVSGFHAVEVELYSGKKFFLGTDEPEALTRALSLHIAQDRQFSFGGGSQEDAH